MNEMKLKPMKKIAINLEDFKERKIILELFESNGWLNLNGKNPTEFINSRDWREDDCVSAGVDAMGAEGYFGFERKQWYLDHGYKVISFSKFLEEQLFESFISDLYKMENSLVRNRKQFSKMIQGE